MQGTGKVYERSGENTEWEDILISKGITTQESVLYGKGLNPEAVGSLSVVSTFLAVLFCSSFQTLQLLCNNLHVFNPCSDPAVSSV
jgi:hypothetical protein